MVKGAMRSIEVLRPSHCPTMPPNTLAGIIPRVGMLAVQGSSESSKMNGLFLRELAPNDNDRQVAESRNLAVPICTVQSKTFRNPRTKPRRLLIAEAEILRQFELRDGDGREAAGDS